MIIEMNHITLAITDINRSFSFYKNILGLTPPCLWDRGAYFLVGPADKIPKKGFWFCLNVDPHRVPSSCYTHYAFTVIQEDFKPMCERIIKANIPLFKENSSPGDSLYFLDPDGHKLEIHSNTWQDRIASKKENTGSWNNIEWFI